MNQDGRYTPTAAPSTGNILGTLVLSRACWRGQVVSQLDQEGVRQAMNSSRRKEERDALENHWQA